MLALFQTEQQQLLLLLLLGSHARVSICRQSAQRVLATFTSWDVDSNGSLSRQEFSAISQVGGRNTARTQCTSRCYCCF